SPSETATSDYGYYADSAAIEYQLAILQSDSLLRRVVVKENLAPLSTRAQDVTEEDAKREAQRSEAAVNQLRGALAVRKSGAQVITISVTWTDPVRAAQLANAVADALVIDQLEARFESAKRASGWLSDRITELRQQLRASEDAVADFRSTHGLTRTGTN